MAVKQGDMFPMIHLLKWKLSNVPQWSHSTLVDLQQLYVRNVFLFCFGLSVTRQFFGPNIICQLDGHRLTQEMLDTKCFINGTFTDFTKTEDAIVPSLNHDYYQWVSLVLLLMAISFHFPFRIWSKYASQFIKELTTHVKTEEDCNRVIHVIRQSQGNNLFWKMFLLECVYFMHLVLQIALMDQFFNRMWSLSKWSYTAIDLLFPEMASCWYDFFSVGDITTGRFRCLLPLNSVYRKVFWITYPVYISLLVLHACFFVYRLCLAVHFGKEWINVWWSLQIAKSRAESWLAKHTLQTAWVKRKKTFEKEDYVSMNNVRVEKPHDVEYQSIEECQL